jgi:hypothetical protein
MSIRRQAVLVAVVGLVASAHAQPSFTWRYLRPGNTGIQGDQCDAIWIGPDNDPWFGSHVPSWEEGGLAKFVQAQNRWINISNVDYPVIGHPNDTGTSRVSDIAQDAAGNLWMATGRGALRFNPTLGPSSLTKFDNTNSALPGGWNRDVDIAPDGSLWFASYATTWGGGGITRYIPATNTWRLWPNLGDANLAVQPKPAGGYWVWAPGSGACQRFDSATQTWTNLGTSIGTPAGLPGKDCVDDAGNIWMFRLTGDFGQSVLDCRRPNGTWIGTQVPTLPAVFRAFGNLQALLVDGNNTTWRFDGTTWSSLGQWHPGAFTSDVNIDALGNVWVSGTGGVAKRDTTTALWQRHRLTNNGQLDGFNEDLAIDPATGNLWACANGAPGIGGMEMFDGTRWLAFNNEQYGLGQPWPWTTDNAQAIYIRPSNGAVIVNPTFDGTKQLLNGTWSTIPGGSSKVIEYVEDSLGRLWGLGEYFSLGTYQNGTFTNHGIAAWGQRLAKDLDRPGTVWAQAGFEIVRTDGVYRFSRTIEDFPELTAQSDTFSGLAVDHNGVAWVGCSVMFGAGGTGGGLIRLDASTGTSTMLTYEAGWPFPGTFVSPLIVTPDGKLWMQYDTAYPYTQRGILWWDGTAMGTFPAPPGGEPQWGGLPHAQIADVELKLIPGGYELWMSCTSRGIAVLKVTGTLPQPCYANCDGSTGAQPLSPADFTCFLAKYRSGDATADCDTSGALSPADFTCFLNKYRAGCQ